MKKILVVGSGAREHALAWKLAQSPSVSEIFVAPGNAGTEQTAGNVGISTRDVEGIACFARERAIDLTVVGPEEPLTAGLADRLLEEGLRVVGPSAEAARIESSKSFAKDLMRDARVPTARYWVFDEAEEARRFAAAADYPLVIKADGLAAGKGVVICAERAEAVEAIETIMVEHVHGSAGARIVVEEFLSGPEISLIALVDGRRAFAFPLSQDHKRLMDGDCGPNTGGMGAYAPVPETIWSSCVSEPRVDYLVRTIMDPVVATLADRGIPYRGILYAGLMLTEDGPRVLEFNCRLGDPETQVLMPLIEGDLLPYLEAVADGVLDEAPAVVPGAAAGIVLAAPGYPDSPRSGSLIHGLAHLPDDMLVFHAGTARNSEGAVITAGGRVLTVVGTGQDVEAAVANAYRFPVWFDHMQLRTDIAWQAKAPSDEKSQAETELVFA